jgi:eukaryotic-like serine/threonine-protein kinase
VKIGRFEIIRELGRGAQSVVYLARDPQLQREIAIKTLHFTRPDPQQNAVLLTEARTISQLRHPNLVPIYEAGEEGGDLFLVFEYVRGKTLAQLVHDAGTLSAVQAATLMMQVLEALEAAHKGGIIHRDLKPSNVLIDERDASRVMDFGIASHIKAREEDEREFTGTPAYMAPEYILNRTISPQSDVFSAGLVLFEMLTGHRAVPGRDVYQIMHRLANEDIAVPRDSAAEIDDRMADILYKALARNPDLRYQSARQFVEALDNFLHPKEQASGDGQQGTLDFLLRRMRHKSDFPALSESVSTINRIAQSDKDSVQKLSSTILRDFALTNKILKLVNSAFFRTSGGGSISTVSRAILVLGFDAVRNLAITVILFEHLQKSPAKAHLMEQFIKSNFAALMARNMGKKAGAYDGEQAFICSLFHSLGRLLAQFYFPDEAEEVRRVMEQRKLTEPSASAKVLGLSYSELGMGIAKTWGFPALIVGSMQELPAGPVHRPHTVDERLRLLSGAANEICEVIAGKSPEERKKALEGLLSRFGEHLSINEAELKNLIDRSGIELSEFASVCHVNLAQSAFGKQLKAIAGKGLAASAEGDAITALNTDLGGSVLGDRAVTTATPGARGMEPPGEAADAQAILTAGIQDISNTLVEGFKLNDILRIILETMYRAMGFRRVILSIKDARTNTMQARFGFGSDANEVAKDFRFSLASPPDVFIAALTKGVDILISDIDDEHIKARVPAWFRKAVSAKTFVLLPLTMKGNPVALIYADRENAGEIKIAEKELSLLRTLRNQAILAIKQSS